MSAGFEGLFYNVKDGYLGEPHPKPPPVVSVLASRGLLLRAPASPGEPGCWCRGHRPGAQGRPAVSAGLQQSVPVRDLGRYQAAPGELGSARQVLCVEQQRDPFCVHKLPSWARCSASALHSSDPWQLAAADRHRLWAVPVQRGLPHRHEHHRGALHGEAGGRLDADALQRAPLLRTAGTCSPQGWAGEAASSLQRRAGSPVELHRV